MWPQIRQNVYYLSTSYNENRPKLYITLSNEVPSQEALDNIPELNGIRVEDLNPEDWIHLRYSEKIAGATGFINREDIEKINSDNNNRNQDDPDFLTQIETTSFAAVLVKDNSESRFPILNIMS